MGKQHNYHAGAPPISDLLEAVTDDWANINVILSRMKWRPKPEFAARRKRPHGTFKASSHVAVALNRYDKGNDRPRLFERRKRDGISEYRRTNLGRERLAVYRARASVSVAQSKTRRRGSA